MRVRHLLAGVAMLAGSAGAASAATITIATVNNSQMVVMQRLSPQWEKATGNHINWVILEENVLRQRATTDITTNSGQFDVMTIGTYEAPQWGKRGWLAPMTDLPASYDLDDVVKTARDGLSYNGTLYALPFYVESSMTYYRKDLFEAAGLKMPDAADLRPDQAIRRQADRQVQGAVRHLPARQGRLGREHGVSRHAREHLRRPLVRREVARRS